MTFIPNNSRTSASSPEATAEKARARTRRTDSLSPERIIAAATEILDERGEAALTFRTLAARLNTGPGAIYWHVANKDDVLNAAADAIMAQALDLPPMSEATYTQIMTIALRVYDAVDQHPWIASQLTRDPWRLTAARVLEAIGSRLSNLAIPPADQLDLASILVNYIFGASIQNASHSVGVPQGFDRTSYLTAAADHWAKLDEEHYPFLHQIMPHLADHDDRTQFSLGLDLLLHGTLAHRPEG